MTRPMLALEAHPDSPWRWQLHLERTTVAGPWQRLEAAVAGNLLAALTDYDGAHVVDHDGVRWLFVSGNGNTTPGVMAGAPLQFRGEPRVTSWARVRVTVSVEVLDGVP